MKLKNNCPVCNKEFDHNDWDPQIYCSVLCKIESQKGKKEYKVIVDIDEIIRLYTEEKISCQEIANRLNTTKKIVSSRLKDSGTKMRSRGEAKSIFLKNNPDKNPYTFPDSKKKIIDRNNRFWASTENREKYSEKISKKWANPEFKERVSKRMSEVKAARTPEQRRDTLIKNYATRKINGTNLCNGLEKKYEKMLIEQNIKYETQYIIPEGVERYRFDFYLLDTHTLVEIQGTGTHADPRVYGPEDVPKVNLKNWIYRPAKEVWENDAKKKSYAESYGYNVLVIWEKDL